MPSKSELSKVQGLIHFDSTSPQIITRVGFACVGLKGLDFASNGTL